VIELLIFEGNILKQVTSEDGVDDSYTYYVNLCRPLVPMPGTNCPAGAWACRVKKQADQESGKHEIQSLGRAVDPPKVDDNGEVRLVYLSSTGYKDGKTKMELHFTFACAYGSLVSLLIQLTIINCANEYMKDRI